MAPQTSITPRSAHGQSPYVTIRGSNDIGLATIEPEIFWFKRKRPIQYPPYSSGPEVLSTESDSHFETHPTTTTSAAARTTTTTTTTTTVSNLSKLSLVFIQGILIFRRRDAKEVSKLLTTVICSWLSTTITCTRCLKTTTTKTLSHVIRF